MDRATAATRPAQGEFRAASPDSGITRPDAAADATGGGEGERVQPYPEGAGGRQPQAGQRGQRRARGQRPGHAAVAPRRGGQRRGVGEPGTRPATGQVAAVTQGASGPGDGTPSVPAGDAPGPSD